MTGRTLAVVLLLSAGLARAQDCPRPEGAGGGVSTQSAQQRLSFLSRVVAVESAKARRWTLGWGATYGLLTVLQLALTGASSDADDVDWYVGAFSSAVGVAFALFDPLEVRDAGPGYVNRAAKATPEDTCALLVEGERMVKEGAGQQAFGTAWFMHVANVAFNAAVGLFLGLFFAHWTAGIVNIVVGAGLGEGTIFTRSTGLVSAWEEYRGARPSSLRFFFAPAVGLAGVGVRAGFTF
ncbi:MAG: hypothetical protein AMXMBFR34_27520 [Myxococcaceae bacterium]